MEFPAFIWYSWNTSWGVRSFKELCGRNRLYSILQFSILKIASSKDKNQFVFKHSSLRLPLKDSMKGLSVGLPGLEKSSVIWFSYAHLSRALDMNSLPLSTWILCGSIPYLHFILSIILTTSSPLIDCWGWIARHLRLKLSTTVKARNFRPSQVWSATKSMLQHWLILETCIRSIRCAADLLLRGRLLLKFNPSCL